MLECSYSIAYDYISVSLLFDNTIAFAVCTIRQFERMHIHTHAHTHIYTCIYIVCILDLYVALLSGCIAGAAIGTYFMPGVGTIIGGIIGSIAGSIAGSYVTPKVVGGGIDTIQQLIKELEIDGIGNKDL